MATVSNPISKANATAQANKISWANVEGETARNTAQGEILNVVVKSFVKTDVTNDDGTSRSTLYAKGVTNDATPRPVKFRVKTAEHLAAMNEGSKVIIERDELKADPAQGRDRDVAFFKFVSMDLSSSAGASSSSRAPKAKKEAEVTN